MSTFQTTETVSAPQEVASVERVLTVFDNRTEQLVAEYSLQSFDLESFKQQFAVADNYDPLMYNVYPVLPKDAGFVSKYLGESLAFDFDMNAYFIECNEIR